MTDSCDHPAEEQAELFWSALQYAIGELAADAADQFETRLEHDQAAREAVAAAVDLISATAGAERQLQAEPAELVPASRDLSNPRYWRAASAWFAAGAAACAMLALTLSWRQNSPDAAPMALRDRAPAPEVPRLTEAWAERAWRYDGLAEEPVGDGAWDADAMMPDAMLEEMLATDPAGTATASEADWETSDDLIISDWLLDAISADRAAVGAGHREG